MRDPRRRRRDRAGGARDRRQEHRDEALWGTWPSQFAARGYTSASSLRRDRLQRDLHQYLGHPGAMNPERGPAGSPRRLDGARRRGIRLERQATRRAAARAVRGGLSMHGDVTGAQRLNRLELLSRAFEEEPPDLMLLETMSLIRDTTFPAIETLVGRGPARLAQLPPLPARGLRRPRPALGRARRRPLRPGCQQVSRTWASAPLMINCLPTSHVTGMLPWLRDFTDIPLGVYANLGRYLGPPAGSSTSNMGPKDYAALARQLAQDEGAQVIGRCCGVTPARMGAAVARGRSRTPSPASRRPPRWWKKQSRIG